MLSPYIFPAALRSSTQSLHFHLDFANFASSHGGVFVMSCQGKPFVFVKFHISTTFKKSGIRHHAREDNAGYCRLTFLNLKAPHL